MIPEDPQAYLEYGIAGVALFFMWHQLNVCKNRLAAVIDRNSEVLENLRSTIYEAMHRRPPQ